MRSVSFAKQQDLHKGKCMVLVNKMQNADNGIGHQE